MKLLISIIACILSNLLPDGPKCSSSQHVLVDNFKMTRCFRLNGLLHYRFTSLHLDSQQWTLSDTSAASLKCTLNLTTARDRQLHVTRWRYGGVSNCSHKNYVTLRDLGISFNDSDCTDDSRRAYTSSTSTLYITFVVGELGTLRRMTTTVVALDTRVFTVRPLSPNFGYVESTSTSANRSSFPVQMSWVSIPVPQYHVVLISFRKVFHEMNALTSLQYGNLRLYRRSKSAKNIVWTTSDREDSLPEFFDTRVMHLRYSGQLKYLRFQLLYTFHEKSSQPSRVGDSLWNCSGPTWADFADHLRCNLVHECLAGEDEAQCVYTGPCGQGYMSIRDRCYKYVQGKAMSWRDSNLECHHQGGYLASLNTKPEWTSVMSALGKRKAGRRVFLGLQYTPGLLPFMYKDIKQWADRTVAFFLYVWIIDLNACGVYPYRGYDESIRITAVCDRKERSLAFLCEFSSTSEEGGGEDSRASQSRIRGSFPPNGSLAVTSVKCPAGHVTHAILACDAESACWPRRLIGGDSQALGGPSRAICVGLVSSPFDLFACSETVQRVPYTVVCDHRQHCADGSDESFCVFSPCSGSTPFQCATSSQCVSLSALCNRQKDCINEADEDLCSYFHSDWRHPSPAVIHFTKNFSASFLAVRSRWDFDPIVYTPFVTACPETHFQCLDNGYCLPVYVLCNGVNDCPGHEDEAGCDSVSCPGFYRCRSSAVCLHPSHVCDDRYQCPQHDDERFCHFTCPVSCTCNGWDFTCHQVFRAKMFPEVRYLDASGSGLTLSHLRQNAMVIHLSLSRCGLTILQRLSFPNLRSLNLSHNDLRTISADHLGGMLNLQYLSVSRNPFKSLFSTHTKELPLRAMRTLDVSGVKLKELNTSNFSFFPALQALNLSHCGIDYVTGGNLDVINKLRVLDAAGCPMTHLPRDLLSGLGELQDVRADNFKLCCEATLPSGFNLARCSAPFDEVSSCQSLLRSDVYVMFTSAFSSLSLVGNLGCFLVKTRHLKKSTSSGFGVFVTHLSVSDFLMGMYLAIIGVADRLYKGGYLWEDISWRHSVPCKLAGFICLLSNEVSAVLICLITLDRFLVLRFPFSSLHFQARSAQLTCTAIWVVFLAMAAAPLIPMTSHWSFYSQTGICIPLPVTRRDFPGRQFAFAILIVFNFILFLIIAAGQAVIYVSIRANTMSTADSTKKSNDLRIARRLISVAVSDFLCWFPVGLLGLLASRGVPISGEVNVGMAIMVLPLNSALNPFLYTINVILERRQQARTDRLLKKCMDYISKGEV